MKKLITTNTGKHPFTLADLGFIQDSTIELAKAIVQALGNQSNPAIVLYGCELVPVGPTTANITAGALFFNGELYLVDATVTPIDFDATPVVIEPIVTYAAPSPVVYKDLSTKNVHAVRKARFIETANASDLGNSVTWSSFSRYNFTDAWHIGGGGSEPAFASGFTTAGTPYQNFRFRLNRSGELEIDGAFGGSQITDGYFNVIQLPLKHRPSKNTFVPAALYVNASGYFPSFIEIQTDGWIRAHITASGGGHTYYLNLNRIAL